MSLSAMPQHVGNSANHVNDAVKTAPVEPASLYSERGPLRFISRWNVVLSAFFQALGVISAFVFGIWAIKSYETSERANALAQLSIQQSEWANKLAVLALCQEDSSANLGRPGDQAILDSAACATALERASLSRLITTLFPPPKSGGDAGPGEPSSQSTSTSTSTRSGNMLPPPSPTNTPGDDNGDDKGDENTPPPKLSLPQIIGIVVACVGVPTTVLVILSVLRVNFARKRARGSISTC